MRIIFINKLLTRVFGGTERHIKELILRLSEKGHKITVLTEKGDMKNLEEILNKKNVRVIFLPSTMVTVKSYKKIKQSPIFKSLEKNKLFLKLFILLKKILTLKKNLKWFINSTNWVYAHRKEFDVMSVHFTYEFEIAKLLNKITGIPYVAFLEGYSYLEADTVKKSKYVTTISKFIQEKCEKVHKFCPEMIPIGVDSDKFRNFNKKKVAEIKKIYSTGGTTLVLNVARLVEGKGIRNMIEAAAIVLKERENIKFINCGDGIERENFEKLIKKLGIEKNFKLIKVFGNDLIDYYNVADIFVHVPDLSSHFGIVYLEAMSTGLPIIASNYEATPSTVGEAALLVEIENPQELAKAIIRLINNSKLRKKLFKEGLKRVEEKFNWEKIIPKIEDLYKRASLNK